MLSIDSVTLKYGDTDILAGCYLSGKKGEIVGLLGRNGSGKSSLLRVIFGTLKADNSHLRIDDQIINKAYLTKKVTYLPQDPFLPPFLKVSTLIKPDSQDCDEDTQLFLAGLQSKKVSELSGGELRILECLWVLHQPADYILLDEPFSGVAPIQVEFLQKVIKSASHTKCIVLTDHLYRALLPISNRVLLLHNKSVYTINDESDLGFYGYIPVN